MSKVITIEYAFFPVFLHLVDENIDLYFVNLGVAEKFIKLFEDALTAAQGKQVWLEAEKDYLIDDIEIYSDASSAFRSLFVKKNETA